MPGRASDGVGGIASRISWSAGLAEPGVNRVSPRLLGFRLEGVLGLKKPGESSARGSVEGKGRLAVDRGLAGARDVLTARFFRLRPFRGGGCFANSKYGRPSSAVRGRFIPVSNEAGGGDSGDEPGDGSVALESSTVEIVVVGEASLDPTADESLMESWWYLRKSLPDVSSG